MFKFVKKHEFIVFGASFIVLHSSALLASFSQSNIILTTLFIILGIISLIGLALSMISLSISREEREKKRMIDEINHKFKTVGYTDEEIEVRQNYLKMQSLRQLNKIRIEIERREALANSGEINIAKHLFDPMNRTN